MFEKFSNLDIDSAGRGGEYVVQVRFAHSYYYYLVNHSQAGFGWTNGVVLWAASLYGAVLAEPRCPNLLSTPTVGGSNNAAAGSWEQIPKSLVLVVIGTLVQLLS